MQKEKTCLCYYPCEDFPFALLLKQLTITLLYMNRNLINRLVGFFSLFEYMTPQCQNCHIPFLEQTFGSHRSIKHMHSLSQTPSAHSMIRFFLHLLLSGSRMLHLQRHGASMCLWHVPANSVMNRSNCGFYGHWNELCARVGREGSAIRS